MGLLDYDSWRNAVLAMPNTIGNPQAAAKDAYGLATGLLGMASPKLPYQGPHKPMTVEGGAARLHDLVPSFGPDIYGPNALQYFGSSGSVVPARQEKAILELMKKVRGNPDAEITIYRGIPEGAKGNISPGDWVTLDPIYAKQYGKVIAQKVKAKDITSWADSLVEFGYYP